MIGEIIQEYLVGLGVKIDKPGFQQADQTIRQLEHVIQQSTGHMAADFVKAGAIITTALASVTASAVGLMAKAAKTDLQMQKTATSMMIGTDAAWKMKAATDALGESINDIAMNPELLGRFRELVADGGKLQVGGDFKETMRGFRDLIFQFTRLKQEVSYAMTWVGYYLMKYLQRPLAEIHERFKSFNDSFVRNIAVWTDRVAKGIAYVVNVGRHLIDFLIDIGKHVKAIWDEFPKGVKIATAALGAFMLVWRMTPFQKILTAISAILLLIDDYYGYHEGKEAAFGRFWDKLDAGLTRARDLYEVVRDKAQELWETFRDSGTLERVSDTFWSIVEALSTLGNGLLTLVSNGVQSFIKGFEDSGGFQEFTGYVERLRDGFMGIVEWLGGLIDGIGKLFQAVGESEEWKEFCTSAGELLSAFYELGSALLDLANTILREFFGELGKDEPLLTFTDLVKAAVGVLSTFVKIMSAGIRALAKLIKMMSNSGPFRAFWSTIGSAVRTFGTLFMDVITGTFKTLGKFGRALLKLTSGDVKGALSILGESVAEASEGRRGGAGGSFGSGTESGLGDNEWNAKVVYQRLRAAGYNDDAIAGIMGRLQQEHNFDTSDVEEHWAEDENGNRVWVGGFGMYQWNGGRKQAFLNWANSQGLNPYDPGVQTDYAIIEAQNRELTPDEMNKMTVEEAADNWTDYWEVGNRGYEREYARDWRERIRQGFGGYTPPPEKTSGGKIGAAAANIESLSFTLPTTDPVLTRGFMSGAGRSGFMPVSYSGGSTSNVINVGGITVNGANATADEIGRSVGDQLMTRLQHSADFFRMGAANTSILV